MKSLKIKKVDSFFYSEMANGQLANIKVNGKKISTEHNDIYFVDADGFNGYRVLMQRGKFKLTQKSTNHYDMEKSQEYNNFDDIFINKTVAYK